MSSNEAGNPHEDSEKGWTLVIFEGVNQKCGGGGGAPYRKQKQPKARCFFSLCLYKRIL